MFHWKRLILGQITYNTVEGRNRLEVGTRIQERRARSFTVLGSVMVQHPHTLQVLDSLRKNSYLGKHRHFAASARTNRLHIWFGLPGVIISVVLGSTFFVLISKEIPIEAKWAAAFAGLLGAVLSALQTFFNFQKISESHRTVANQYLSIQRDCDQLIASYCDGLVDLHQLAEQLSKLNLRYQEVNKAAEGSRTNKHDYATALQHLKELEAGEVERGETLQLSNTSPQDTQDEVVRP
jgi:hypothetical protein